jgi:hypothetical protein
MSDGTPPHTPQASERRVSPRKRVILSGKIIYSHGSFTVDCRITNISETGARIVLPAGQIIPTHIVLLEVRSRVAYEAELVRLAPPEFGLKFLSKHLLDGILPPHLQYVKRFG